MLRTYGDPRAEKSSQPLQRLESREPLNHLELQKNQPTASGMEEVLHRCQDSARTPSPAQYLALKQGGG